MTWGNDILKNDLPRYYRRTKEAVIRLIRKSRKFYQKEVRDELITLMLYLERGKPIDGKNPFDICCKREKQAEIAGEGEKAALYKVLANFFLQNPSQRDELETNHSYCIRCTGEVTKEAFGELLVKARAVHSRQENFIRKNLLVEAIV